MTRDRSDLRAAILSAAEDWRADDTRSWQSGTDPIRMLLTLKDSGEIDPINAVPVYFAVARYADRQSSRAQLVDELVALIPDGAISLG